MIIALALIVLTVVLLIFIKRSTIFENWIKWFYEVKDILKDLKNALLVFRAIKQWFKKLQSNYKINLEKLKENRSMLLLMFFFSVAIYLLKINKKTKEKQT